MKTLKPLLFAGVTGQVIDNTGNPWGYAVVQFSLFVPSGQTPIDVTTGLVIPNPEPIVCDGTGSFTASLQTSATVVPDSLWQLTVYPFNSQRNGQTLEPIKITGAIDLTSFIQAHLQPHVDEPLILPMSNNGSTGQSPLNGSLYFDVEAQELAVKNPATGTYISIPTLSTPPVFDEPVQAPYFLAVGLAPPEEWPDSSLLIDFQAATQSGRFMAKSNNTSLANVQIAASSSDADGRFLIYAIFGEVAGPGTALANFAIPISSPSYRIIGEFSGAPLADGSAFVDFQASTGGTRILSRSTTTALGQIQLSGLSNTADGRFNEYILCSEPSGPGSATVSIGGDLVISGTKAFRITHPQDDTKKLTHACLEGPENGVFYRGEGETRAGLTTIVLPDYFEALTRPEGRTVLLTTLVDDDNPVFGGQLAAGRVTEGRFNVYSEDSSQKFYWEVKAVRADLPTLEVVT